MEHPRPPSSLSEQPSNDFLRERLKRQLRGDGSQDQSREELKRIVREQLPKTPMESSAYMLMLLESLDDDKITTELFWYALDHIPAYAPTDANGALRPEDYDDSH